MSDQPRIHLALAGNPNCGKTTLFNGLTGAHQKVGNWPGVTVERKEGHFKLDQIEADIVDLPGVYSFEQDEIGLDEQIARTYLTEQRPDLILNVVDASNIERHLLLTSQLVDLNIPTILVLNMMDVAEAAGVKIEIEELQKRLGIPVTAVVAAKGTGLAELKALIQTCVADKTDLESSVSIGKPEVDDPAEATLKRFEKIRSATSGVVTMEPVQDTLTDRIDRFVLNKYLGVPVFLGMMYLMFTLAINVGAVFIDFFDILFGAVFVDGFTQLLEGMGSPAWLNALLADGLGGGIQLVATFVPVIGFLYFFLSILEDTGYMARAAFVVDRVMRGIGLPGNAFVPLIVGFGCNVPSVMAARTLNREQDRLLTIAMAPFMSCGARLTVYALFAAAFFPDNGPTVVFALYLMGIVMAVFTGWIFKKTLFDGAIAPSYQEMPTYHVPVFKNIVFTTWHRLKSFISRAGKTIVAVVVVLSFLNSWGTDGSFGNQDSKDSVLSEIGRSITPAFEPIGLQEENWPATVGIFTGIFAKEAVVGTLDALYSEVGGAEAEEEAFVLQDKVVEAFESIWVNAQDLTGALTDPLGLGAVDIEDVAAAAEEQEVGMTTLTTMNSLFVGTFGAFCYLVFVLLYTPCVAVMGAMTRESGLKWTGVVVMWSTGMAYWAASTIYQIGTFAANPTKATITLLIVNGLFIAMVLWLKRLGQKAKAGESDLIPVTNV